ncbi:MAG: UDP-N-acetylglucosamine 1-carboxyvinyltransferase [Cyanobacteria bacterium J083]|nr:MAG: UDP-N-acetylglucosamine 1-carboxyvinyltransferase [Cyanobacteria bacterium J083]
MSHPNQTANASNSQPILEIAGQASLTGEVRISGAKNSALVLMAGALLCPGQCRLHNVPSLVDISRMAQILTSLGLKITKNRETLEIDAKQIKESQAPYDVVSQLRASFFVIGPLLARQGEANVPLPGGCAIGARPVDLHVQGLRALGAQVEIESGIVKAKALGKNGKLKGGKIYLNYPSVGATETIIMAATLAEGETILENAAQEPEIVDLANFCRTMGANIEGAGTSTITISGVEKLRSFVDYTVVPDRIEAGTFLAAGAITHSEISLYPVVPAHLAPVIAKLRETGSQVVQEDPHRLRIIPDKLQGTDIKTWPYPGFPTDMQAQFMALLSICQGNSVITETVFENRMGHVAELNRMGANIRVEGKNAFITGVSALSGAPVTATDLRASAALVIAGLAATGTTIVQGLHHLDRGYDDIEGKLKQLGAPIRRISPA